VVTLPGASAAGAGAASAPGSGSVESPRLPAFDLPPGRGADTDTRRSAIRNALREADGRRGRVPPSVAPSLSERERFARDVENALRKDCADEAKDKGLANIPSVVSGVLTDRGCRIR
jgi:hypothetical protein